MVRSFSTNTLLIAMSDRIISRPEREIPMDVIEDILVKLPVKSLMRFKCVSKQWLSSISSHRFALRYLSLAKDPNFTSFFIVSDKKFITPLSVGLDGSVNIGSGINLPLPVDDSEFLTPALVSAGFGFYCVFGNYDGAFQLWNPTTGECIGVPPPPRDDGAYVTFYFGNVDCRDGVFSYKVCLVTETSANLTQSLELYSSKTKTWKVIPEVFYGEIHATGDETCVIMNGKSHWLTFCGAWDEYFDNITTFDYENEVLGSIPIPLAPEVGRYDMWKGILTVWDESFLCLVLFLEKDENAFLDIWIMRDYGVQDSWSKEFTVGPICQDAKVLGLSSKIDGIFLWEKASCPCSLKLYDIRSSTIKEISLPDEFNDRFLELQQIKDHVESIISASM